MNRREFLKSVIALLVSLLFGRESGGQRPLPFQGQIDFVQIHERFLMDGEWVEAHPPTVTLWFGPRKED